MRILFNDIIQGSNAPDALKSPALSDVTPITNGSIVIVFDRFHIVDCMGIGNTDGTWFQVNGHRINFVGNGLYILPLNNQFNTDGVTVSTNATFVGRLAMGRAVQIGTGVRKEPSFNSTAEPRTTLSGQVIPGRGGHIFRAVSLDSRYKIDETMMNEIKEGYRYISMGYPFFVNLEDEAYKLPFDRLYAIDRNQRNMSFESGVTRFLYSRRWDFEERF